jgi:hypothetical protein
MKKPWLLIIAGIVLTIVIGLWLYLFFGGDDAKEDLYNAFGLNGSDLPFGLETLLDDSGATSTPAYLRQLTLRQVAGYVPLEASTSTSRSVRFVEKGTGHIYSVPVDGDTEERLSNITIPNARQATISADGSYAAVYTDNASSFTVVTLAHGSTALSSNTVDGSPISLTFTTDNTLLYAVKDGQSVVGYTYNVKTTDKKPLFSIPFREAVILWGDSEAGPHYVYPKTAEELEGYLYKTEANTLKRLPISGFGLSVKSQADNLLYTRFENGSSKSYVFKNNEETPLSVSFIPEKCSFRGQIFVCAIHGGEESLSLTSWYRGEVESNDSLWYFIPDINYATSIENLSATAGRIIDVISPATTEKSLYFINNIDSGLWVYDRDFESSVINN